MVELALTDTCKEYGITPPRGILLHGISGTGKTLIAKSIASSLTNCKFFTINGPDFFSGFLGESEAKVFLYLHFSHHSYEHFLKKHQRVHLQ